MADQTPNILNVLNVDDHDIVRKGLVMLISRQEDMRVGGKPGPRPRRSSKPMICLPTSWCWTCVFQMSRG